MQTGTMHIGELAERTGLSLRTLRHYDEIGLVRASGRTEGGFRLYTPEDLDRLLLIRRMKPLGFSLDEMRQLLEALDRIERSASPDPTALRELDTLIADAETRQRQLGEQLAMAEEFVAALTARRRRTVADGAE